MYCELYATFQAALVCAKKATVMVKNPTLLNIYDEIDTLSAKFGTGNSRACFSTAKELKQSLQFYRKGKNKITLQCLLNR